MTDRQGRQLSLFPENFNNSQSRAEGNIDIKGNIPGNFEAGNSLNLAVVAVVNQYWQATVYCIPSDIITFAILPA